MGEKVDPEEFEAPRVNPLAEAVKKEDYAYAGWLTEQLSRKARRDAVRAHLDAIIAQRRAEDAHLAHRATSLAGLGLLAGVSVILWVAEVPVGAVAFTVGAIIYAGYTLSAWKHKDCLVCQEKD